MLELDPSPLRDRNDITRDVNHVSAITLVESLAELNTIDNEDEKSEDLANDVFGNLNELEDVITEPKVVNNTTFYNPEATLKEGVNLRSQN